MSDLGRLLDPKSVAIVGLSADPAKHGGRVLANLRKLGFPGQVWGVNPGLPSVEGVKVFSSLSDLPDAPDLVVCAVPAHAVRKIAMGAEGVGALMVFAGGFGESGDDGMALEADLSEWVHRVGFRLLGPNSGGVIRRSKGLAASFLTCLDRNAGEIRSGPVGLVTQSGGTGSYIHNLAAARGGGLAVSVSTGNEIDIRLGEAISAVSVLDEVKVVLALIETVRDGQVFIDAVRESVARWKAGRGVSHRDRGSGQGPDDNPYRGDGRAGAGAPRRARVPRGGGGGDSRRGLRHSRDDGPGPRSRG